VLVDVVKHSRLHCLVVCVSACSRTASHTAAAYGVSCRAQYEGPPRSVLDAFPQTQAHALPLRVDVSADLHEGHLGGVEVAARVTFVTGIRC
jgi:hypothetical protein